MIANAKGSILIDDLYINESGSDSLWTFDSIEGWHAGVGVELTRTSRAAGHGELVRRGRRTGRQIIVSGDVYAETRGPVEAASRRLASLLADGNAGRFDFFDADGPALWAPVQMADAPRVEWPGKNHFRYQLTLFSPDPYRYGDVSSGSTGFASGGIGRGLRFPLFTQNNTLTFGPPPTSNGEVTVSNPGSAPASPVFSIAGPTPEGGFTITDVASGRRVRFVGSVPAGSTLVMDASDGSVLIDGTGDRSGDTLATLWPIVEPGATATYMFTPESTTSEATLTVDLTATYW